MNKIIVLLVFYIGVLSPFSAQAQNIEDQVGAWYMYFYNTTFKESPWGIQGDLQYRNWNLGGDLEQLLIRSGVTFKPEKAPIKFTLGYGNITSGTFGDDASTSGEHRVYQEALFPVKFGRVHTNHRFRYEQRFVDNQDFRTRYRYNLFLNIPINKAVFEKNTLYLALYNEIFINGQRPIGSGKYVELFDRNRAYMALGFVIKKGLRVQAGFMNQTTDQLGKNQIQLSLHHKF